jgi:glycosyltransferase involved in cell wall biosynthesis
MTAASIVVPSRAGAGRLPVLFSSLARQDTTDWEVIVVLDGDVDDSAGVVEAWSGRIPVRPLVFEQNRGRAAALNAGFDAAVGDVLIRCDDDLELRPGHVGGHVARHAAGRQGVVGLTKNVLPHTPYARAYGNRADEHHRRSAYTTGETPWRHWAANVSVTRSVMNEVGPYDEGFRAYGWEDVDWGYRLHLLGIPVVIAEELEALHHGAATTAATRAQRAFYSGVARLRFDAKHGPDALPSSARTDAWSRLVRRATSGLDEQRVTRRGALVDSLLPWLPATVGRKAVALLVESAALAGHSSTGETQQAI